MKIEVEETPEKKIVRLRGTLDLYASGPVRAEIVKQIDSAGTKEVVVDLSGVNYIDSGGMSSLVAGLKESREKKVELVLTGMNGKVKGVFEMTKLIRIFDIRDSGDLQT
jgi:anti-sigma B factor antagonist